MQMIMAMDSLFPWAGMSSNTYMGPPICYVTGLHAALTEESSVQGQRTLFHPLRTAQTGEHLTV